MQPPQQFIHSASIGFLLDLRNRRGIVARQQRLLVVVEYVFVRAAADNGDKRRGECDECGRTALQSQNPKFSIGKNMPDSLKFAMPIWRPHRRLAELTIPICTPAASPSTRFTTPT